MWAKASIFRIGPFWPPRRTRALVVDDGRALTLDEPAVIDETLALGDKLGEAANSQQQRDATIAVADDRLGREPAVLTPPRARGGHGHRGRGRCSSRSRWPGRSARQLT